MSTTFRAAADEMRLLIQTKVEEIKSDPRMVEVLKLHKSLNGLEDLLSEPQTPLEDLFGLTANQATPGKTSIRFDEFAGYSPLEAAKRYLKKMPDARPIKEIIDAILQGGGKVGSEANLETSLGRSSADIVKIKENYGWIENYPHIKAQRTAKTRKTTTEKDATEGASVIEMGDQSKEGKV